jgi:hypothetical protein
MQNLDTVLTKQSVTFVPLPDNSCMQNEGSEGKKANYAIATV